MYRSGQSLKPSASDLPRGYRPRVVVKLRDGLRAPGGSSPLVAAVAPQAPGGGQGGGWQPLLRRFQGATVAPVFTTVPAARLTEAQQQAARAAGGARVPDLQSFFVVTLPAGADSAAVIRAARELNGVEEAHVEGPPAPPPVSPADDPRSSGQGYLNAASAGIDARHAWLVPGGDGRNVGFVDLEQGWTLNHEDLAGAGIGLISGVSKSFHGHGTAVLGEILAQDNTKGCIGITPAVSARVVSQWRSATNFNTADAIFAAAFAMRAGDILLLEAQTTVGSSTFLPVEVESQTWAAIFIATLLGRIVIEAGGNGGNDLDTYQDSVHGFILKRGHANFRESGAIMVGAASSNAPHSRLSFSNYGSRVDCYAWGQNINTTGDGWQGTATSLYTTSFGGTSGASPIVTGAAIALQGMVKAAGKPALTPARMRQVLCDPRLGTRSNVPAADRIGVMPDLRKIVAELGLRQVGDFPTPRKDVQYA